MGAGGASRMIGDGSLVFPRCRTPFLNPALCPANRRESQCLGADGPLGTPEPDSLFPCAFPVRRWRGATLGVRGRAHFLLGLSQPGGVGAVR